MDDLQKQAKDEDRRFEEMEANYSELHACHTSLINESGRDKAELENLKTSLQSIEQEKAQIQEMLQHSQIDLDKISKEQTMLNVKLEHGTVQFKQQQEALRKSMN